MHTASKRVFVGNLPSTVDENALRQEFAGYGEVDKIEIKTKGLGEAQTYFAFVTLSLTTDNDINKCLKRFSNQPFHGAYLKVDVARESFMDRLKREWGERDSAKTTDRTKYEAKGSTGASPVVKISPASNLPMRSSNQKKVFAEESSSSSDSSDSSTDEGGGRADLKDTSKKPSVKKAPQQQKVDDADIFVAKKNALSSVQNGKIKIERVASEPIHVISKSNEPTVRVLKASAQESEKKRKESLHKMKDQYDKQKLAIKQALTNIDGAKKSSKIVFDADDYEAPQQTPDVSSNRAKKRNLFDDEDNGDEETPEDYRKNFEIKEQFQGEKGAKLMKLQSKFKSDSRFAMDTRFLEEDSGDEAGTKQETSKTVSENQKESTDINDEREWQLSLLEEVVGQKLFGVRPPQKKVTTGLITRFDPTKEEHKKFLKSYKEETHVTPAKTEDEPTESEVQNEPESKVQNEPESEVQNESISKPEIPQVSTQTFYRVSGDLKKAFSHDDSGGQKFSLLKLFGRAEEDTSDQNKSPKYTEIPIASQSGVVSALAKANPFKYDSSDSEDDGARKPAKTTANGGIVSGVKTKKPNDSIKVKLPTETFFLATHDKRLDEGVGFFKAPERDPDRDVYEVRRELFTIITKKIAKKKKSMKGFKKIFNKMKKK